MSSFLLVISHHKFVQWAVWTEVKICIKSLVYLCRVWLNNDNTPHHTRFVMFRHRSAMWNMVRHGKHDHRKINVTLRVDTNQLAHSTWGHWGWSVIVLQLRSLYFYVHSGTKPSWHVDRYFRSAVYLKWIQEWINPNQCDKPNCWNST